MAELLTLPNVLAGIMLLGLNAYALMGGADYGGGVWDLLASGPRREKQRALITHAIGPIWEANHVWLIFVVVLLFTCFPPAFAIIAVELHVPITLMLVGVVLRGSAFIFRTYHSEEDAVQRRWGLIFSFSSVFTPAMLGICIGALASGSVAHSAAMAQVTFVERYVTSWANPFAFGVGAMALSLFAFLAAVYLTIEAEGDRELQDDFRRRALRASAAVFVCAFGTLALAGFHAPLMTEALTGSPLSLPLHIATGVAALGAIAALLARRYRLARFAAGAQVSLILWGWAVASYPYLVPTSLSIESAAAPPTTLRLTLITVAIGALLLIPSLAYLFRVFKGKPSAFENLSEGAGEAGG